MAFKFAFPAANWDPSGSRSSWSETAGSAVAVGDRISAFVPYTIAGDTTVTLADNLGNTYTEDTTAKYYNGATDNNLAMRLFYCVVTNAGTPTLTASAGAACTLTGIFATVEDGLGNRQASVATKRYGSVSTGTDGVTANALTIVDAPARVICFTFDFNGANGDAMTAGTGFTSRLTGLKANGLADLARLEDGPAASAGSFTATWTAAQAGSGAIVAVIAYGPGGPVINTQPTDQQANIGGSATFSISATTSGGALSYQWKFNGSNVGTNSASYTRTGVVYGDQRGAVTCDVTDSNGTTVSATARLLVTFAAAGTGPRRRNVLGVTAVGTLGILGAATGGPAYSATGNGGGLASSTETTARLDTGAARAGGRAAATETTARIAAASTTGTGRAAGTGAKGVAWAATGTATGKASTTESKGASASITARGTGVGSATGLHGAAFAGTTTGAGRGSDSYTVASVRSSSATATGGGMATGAALHATAQSGLARAGGRALATEATARTAAGVTLATGKATATETTARTAAGTIKAGGLVADSYSIAIIRATFGTATGGGRGTASGLHAIALQGLTRAGGKVTGAALHAVALGAIVKGGGTVATVGAKASAWSATVRGGGFADDSYLINHIDYGRAPVGGRAFMLRDADTARPHGAETERPAVISGTRAGNINTARPANRGGRRP